MIVSSHQRCIIKDILTFAVCVIGSQLVPWRTCTPEAAFLVHAAEGALVHAFETLVHICKFNHLFTTYVCKCES